MIHALLHTVCIVGFLSTVNAAPRCTSGRDAGKAYRYEGNNTAPSKRSGQPSEPPVFPTFSSTTSSISGSPSGSSVPVTTPVSSVPSEVSLSISPTTAEAAVSSKSDDSMSSAISASATATPSSFTSDSSNLNAIQAWLDGHNTVRQQHGAANLAWSDTLASYAQSWANGCNFEHSGGQYGENLYAETGNNVPVSDATSAWASEASQYDPSNPTYSHFTQMVWKSTTQLGCASASCEGIFNPSYGQATYYVCEYNPPGNVIGEFGDNVQV